MRYEYCLMCAQKYDERNLKLRICVHCRDGIYNLEESSVNTLEVLDIPPFDSMFPHRTRPTKTPKLRKEGINLHSIRKRLRTHQLGRI